LGGSTGAETQTRQKCCGENKARGFEARDDFHDESSLAVNGATTSNALALKIDKGFDSIKADEMQNAPGRRQVRSREFSEQANHLPHLLGSEVLQALSTSRKAVEIMTPRALDTRPAASGRSSRGCSYRVTEVI
jgi:hypothetical protein